MPKFIRTDSKRHSRLGKNRKKLQVWRRARGRHSKIRRKRFGYPRMPKIGYATSRKESGLVQGLKPVLVSNMKEISNVKKGSIIILARVGAKKKLEMIKKSHELGFKIANLGGKK